MSLQRKESFFLSFWGCCLTKPIIRYIYIYISYAYSRLDPFQAVKVVYPRIKLRGGSSPRRNGEEAFIQIQISRKNALALRTTMSMFKAPPGVRKTLLKRRKRKDAGKKIVII